MIDRIGDSRSFDPSRKANSPDAFKEKMQKIEKTCKEEELDKEKLRRLFPQEEELEGISIPAFLAPASHQSRGPAELVAQAIPPSQVPQGFEHLREQVIPTPPAFPPPSIGETSTRSSTPPDKKLPQSNGFWEEFDMPDDPPPRRNFEEVEHELPVVKKQQNRDENTQPAGKKKLDSQQELLAAVQSKQENEEGEESEDQLDEIKTSGSDQDLAALAQPKQEENDEAIASAFLRPALRDEQRRPEPEKSEAQKKKRKTRGFIFPDSQSRN